MVCVLVRDYPAWCGRGCAWMNGATVGSVLRAVAEDVGVENELVLYLLHNGRVLSAEEVLRDGDVLRLRIRLPGGKGGFGNMLRGQGTGKKTTNFDACRDLNGRRLRLGNNEERLAAWNQRQQEAAASREPRNMQNGSPDIREGGETSFDAEKFEEKLTGIESRVNEALSKGLEIENEFREKGPENRSLEDELIEAVPKKRRIFMDVDEESDSESENEDSGGNEDSNDSTAERGSMGAPPQKPGASVRFEAPSLTSREPSPVVSSLAYSVSTEPVSDCGESSYAHSETITETVTEPTDETASVGSHLLSMTSLPPLPPQLVPASGILIETVPAVEINLNNYSSATELESLGLQVLKAELQKLGLKCGGTLTERAKRLFMIKGRDLSTLDRHLLARKPQGQKLT
eukprot:Plantae.Rhodophyta-Purpureofilum_apyrenoidigerum.ctg287.p1 GENE.Plantae.Rhodophyta-Purpureofilum_apyrenoidigerum.ctg287~~Plantae.Rhodophyta-Purpureofilum_apyrenoidigerum.ctg287.p1  ORF type:complete len:422 (-),score=59.57 Plantae.Rhodophyta-Purpureofilum_apyrenoidigerum.ctg287:359-1567(-)